MEPMFGEKGSLNAKMILKVKLQNMGGGKEVNQNESEMANDTYTSV